MVVVFPEPFTPTIKMMAGFSGNSMEGRRVSLQQRLPGAIERDLDHPHLLWQASGSQERWISSPRNVCPGIAAACYCSTKRGFAQFAAR